MVIKTCEFCGTEFKPKQPGSKFCSRKCMPSQRRTLMEVTCTCCGRIRQCVVNLSEQRNPVRMCPSCSSDANAGPQNGSWKGGHRHWSPGRFGRDKDGLSWKTQRRLAWERDKFTCQECGKHKDGWKPDVHHVSPFRVSQSHALGNLKCYCRRCHLREEAKVQEGWGGSQLAEQHSPRTRPYCSVCDCWIQGPGFTGPGGELVCHDCKGPFLVAQAMALAAQGLTPTAIAGRMGVSRMTAYYYSQGYRSCVAKRRGIKTAPFTSVA